MKFILQNSEEYDLDQLAGCGAEHVIHAWLDHYGESDEIIDSGEIEILIAGSWKPNLANNILDKKCVYRVLAKPYTLEDALKDIAKLNKQVSTGGSSSGYEHCVTTDEAMDVIRKLADSLGDKS